MVRSSKTSFSKIQQRKGTEGCRYGSSYIRKWKKYKPSLPYGFPGFSPYCSGFIYTAPASPIIANEFVLLTGTDIIETTNFWMKSNDSLFPTTISTLSQRNKNENKPRILFDIDPTKNFEEWLCVQHQFCFVISSFVPSNQLQYASPRFDRSFFPRTNIHRVSWRVGTMPSAFWGLFPDILLFPSAFRN